MYLLRDGISGDAGHELPGLLVAGHPGDEATGHTVCKEAADNIEDDPTDTGEELSGCWGGDINDDGGTIGVVVHVRTHRFSGMWPRVAFQMMKMAKTVVVLLARLLVCGLMA